MSEPHSPESPRQKTTTGRVDDRTLSLLYLNGTSPYVDLATTQLLAEVSRNVRITTVANAVDAHATLQKATGDGRFHGLLLSPTLSAEYALQLVTTFREDRVPVAIVPVVTEAHHGLCTNAVAAGADAVLLLLNGALVSPEETLDRIWDSPHLPEDEPQAVAVGAGRRAFERLQTLFLRPKTNGHATAGDANASDATPDDGRVRLRALLNEAHVARVRTESVLGLEKPAKQSSSDAWTEAREPQPPKRPFVERRRRDRRKDSATKAELDHALEDALDARKSLRQALDKHSREQAAWDNLRRDLEARTNGLHAATDANKELAAGLDAAVRAKTELQTSLDSTRRQLQDATERLISERTTWSAARQKLEVGLADLQVTASAKGELDARLNAARQELQKAVDRQREEQSAWGTAREKLQARIRDLEAAARAKTELDGELETSRKDLQERTAQLASERSNAEGLRRELKSRTHELQTAASAKAEVEAKLNTARDELQRAAAAHASQTAAWDTTRQELEGRARELEAAARAKTELEGDLQTARNELQHATGRLAAERSTSEAVRRDLESRTHELLTASSATSDLEAKLKVARVEMRQAAEAQASKRSGWEAARRTLETTLNETRAELQRVVQMHGSQAAAWETARQEFEARVHDRDAIVRAKADLERELESARKERQDAIEQLASEGSASDSLRQELQSRIHELQQAVETHGSQAAAWETARQEFEARVHDRDVIVRAKADLERELETARQELGSRTYELQAATSATARLEEDLKALQRATDEHTSERDAWESSRRQFEQTIRDAEAAHQALQAQLNDVTNQLHALSTASDRAALEERLRQARRVEEVGHLAAAMAPDLETLVSAIREHGSRLLRDSAHSDSQREDAEAIRAASEQVISILHQLQAFSRRQVRPLSTIDINDALKRLEPVLARLAGTEIDFTVRVGETAIVAISDDDFDQLVTTLMFSARELLTVGGSLLVETSLVDARIRLAVTASGYGVQPAQSSPALDLIVRRCSTELEIDGARGRTSILRAYLPVAPSTA
jgi:chromosome segregation ATPase